MTIVATCETILAAILFSPSCESGEELMLLRIGLVQANGNPASQLRRKVA